MVGDCAVTVVHEALGKNNRWCRRQSRLRVQCAAREPAGFPVANDAEEAGIREFSMTYVNIIADSLRDE
jgi:hypothetical protein